MTHLPDDLEPRRILSQEGRPEDYWTARNALVDAVKAAIKTYEAARLAKLDDPAAYGKTYDAIVDALARYSAAKDALKTFDAANGGTPIL
jgi:hypothetical protein